FRMPGPGPAVPALDADVLGWGLAALAALLVLATGAVAASWVAIRVGSPLLPLPPLERALRAVGAALRAAPEERRKALDALAIALDGAGAGELAERARALAWSEQRPD